MSANWQEKVTDFVNKRNLHHPISVYALDLMSEVGEVAKEILLASNYGEQTPVFTDDKIQKELGDVLYSLCLVASAADVDLDEALTAALTKYKKRWSEKGTLGSS